MKATYRREGGEFHEVRVEATGPRSARVLSGDLDVELTFVPLGPGRFRLSDGRRAWSVCVDRDGARRHVTIEGEGEARFEREDPGRRRRRDAAEGSLSSPMPGTVVKVLVAPGEAVEKGQSLVVVEAMKMEIKIAAPHDGVVQAVACSEGDPCDAGQSLVELEAAASSPAGEGS
jgi:3-methylcrotonyl-CoA carboxylase alpha subunit